MPTETSSAESVAIAAKDGFKLAATVYRADAPVPRGVVVVNSAMAVPQGFYARFCGYLASVGLSAVSYDYRGIGQSRSNQSRSSSLRGSPITMNDWIFNDMDGVIDWTVAEFGVEQVGFVGHSFGGQVAGLLENSDRISRALTISSLSGNWKHQVGARKALFWFHVHLTLPMLAKTFGFVPWSKFSSAEDLPKSVAETWARWARSPGYLLDDELLPVNRFAEFNAPVLAYSFDDDTFATSSAVDAMMNAYPNLERRHVEPSAFGLDNVGHMGFFRAASQPLWSDAADWLVG